MQLQLLRGRLLLSAGRTGSIIMLFGEDVAPLQDEQAGATVSPSLPLWHHAQISLLLSFLVLLLITSCNVTQTTE